MGQQLGGSLLRSLSIAIATWIMVPGAAVKSYPVTPGMATAADRQITADGTVIPVYETPVNYTHTYLADPPTEPTPVAYFDFSGSTQVTVTSTTAVTSAVLRPLSYGVVPVVNGNKITFTLNRPGQYTLELNNNLHRALHLFADSMEANPRTAGVGDMIYYGPGEHSVGSVGLHSGQSVYIAGGAVVYGSFFGDNVNNVRITGRGILSGNKTAKGSGDQNLIRFGGNSHDFSVSGIILLNSPTWNFNIRQSNNIHIDDVKIIGARANSDGIDFVSCQNVWVNNSFVRAWDDCLCVKGDNVGNSTNLNFNGCVIWTDLAQSMEIGYETRADQISGVTFKNIDVIHNLHKPVMSIHAGSQATISGISYEDIRVEDKQALGDGQNWLIDLWVGTSDWTSGDPRGKISGVSFKNITASAPITPKSRMYGFDASHNIQGVTIDNLSIMGKAVRSVADGGITLNAFAATPTFTYNTAIVPQAYALPIGTAATLIGLDAGKQARIRFRAPMALRAGIRDASGRWSGPNLKTEPE